MTESLESLPAAVRQFVDLLEDRKAIDLMVFNVGASSVLADYVIVCSGNSGPQLRALRDSVDEGMKHQEGHRLARNIEGSPDGNWIVMDYHDVLIHIFHPVSREYYDLEGMLEDAPQVYGCRETDFA